MSMLNFSRIFCDTLKTDLFGIEIFCKIMKVFAATFDQFNASSLIKVLISFRNQYNILFTCIHSFLMNIFTFSRFI